MKSHTVRAAPDSGVSAAGRTDQCRMIVSLGRSSATRRSERSSLATGVVRNPRDAQPCDNRLRDRLAGSAVAASVGVCLAHTGEEPRRRMLTHRHSVARHVIGGDLGHADRRMVRARHRHMPMIARRRRPDREFTRRTPRDGQCAPMISSRFGSEPQEPPRPAVRRRAKQPMIFRRVPAREAVSASAMPVCAFDFPNPKSYTDKFRDTSDRPDHRHLTVEADGGLDGRQGP
ncbi:hypothetical protein ATI53_100186 [Salipiger aestuarii]|uniref:Uncharacterized protein n=1 Tax=Salipiger aestuarii TaxID=568098 RepID=A0A327Z171_9RHOB|nr:hypothetical protein ATI53_100186 [Salipiger aestuarii]